MNIEWWQLGIVAVGQVLTFGLAAAGLVVKVRNQDQAREDKRQENANAQLQKLTDKITDGDEHARAKAAEQIEGVRLEVTDMRARVDALEREVAAMPTREQLDRGFKDLRDLMGVMTQRIDFLVDRRAHDLPPGE